MMQRNYEDIHPITKQINQQTFINPYKKISPTEVQPSKQQGEAGYQMIFARISSNHRSGTKLAGYIPHQES